MTRNPDEPVTDPAVIPDDGPDIAPPDDGEGGVVNPFAPGEGFTPGQNPRDDPQSQPNNPA